MPQTVVLHGIKTAAGGYALNKRAKVVNCASKADVPALADMEYGTLYAYPHEEPTFVAVEATPANTNTENTNND